MELWIVWAVVGAGVCYYVAGQKGRNQVTWAVIGAIFGLFGIIAVFIVSDLTKQPAAGLAPAPAATTAAAAPPPAAPAPAAAEAPPPTPMPEPVVATPTPEPVATAPVPPVSPETASAAEPDVAADPGLSPARMPCPNCGESIARAAKVCRFCNHELAATS